jgi:DNA-binding MarR family transcriptional regulator
MHYYPLCRKFESLFGSWAEPAIAERDQKLRAELKRIVGSSSAKSKAVLLMDGTRTQRDIHRETGMNVGNLSTLVKQLKNSKLVSDDPNPTLAIKIPSNFFKPQ